MEQLKAHRQNWKNKLTYESPHGSIKVADSMKGKNSKFDVQFISPDNQIISLGTRRSAAYALKQLLDNFGNYTQLSQFEDENQTYTHSVSQYQAVIGPLTKKLQDTNLVIEKEPVSHSMRYRISYRSAIENPDSGEM